MNTMFTSDEISEITHKIKYDSYFRQGKQYIDWGGVECKVDSLLKLMRICGVNI